MKILQNKIIGTQTSFFTDLVVNWEFNPVVPFFLSASTTATYIFTAPTCTTNIISLESNLVR